MTLTDAQVKTIVDALPEPLARALVDSPQGRLVIGGMRAGMLEMLSRLQVELDSWPQPGERADLPVILQAWIVEMRARVEAIDPEAPPSTLPACRGEAST